MKLCLDGLPKKFGHVRQSSEELIDELQDKLGESTSDYLTVTFSCKPSVLPNYRGSKAAPVGMAFYGTSLTVKAKAIIKRHSSNSSWTRVQSISNLEINRDNPVIGLISSHYPVSTAQDIIRTITSTTEGVPNIYRRILGSDTTWESSSEAVIPISGTPSFDNNSSPKKDSPISALDITEAYVGRSSSSRKPLTPRPSEEVDPARQIWSQMRQVSRSCRKPNRDPSSSTETTHTDELLVNIEKQQAQHFRNEQTRIMQIALRNKRSIGADTLRSMAMPSTKMGFGTGKNVWSWLW